MIKSLDSGSGKLEKPIASVSLLGGKGDLQWKQNSAALVITKPSTAPLPGISPGFRIAFKE